MAFTTQWNLEKPAQKTLRYDTALNANMDILDYLLGGGAYTKDGGDTVNQYDVIYEKSGDTVDQAQADAIGTMPAWGFARAVSGNDITVQRSGYITNGGWSWTPGDDIYVDAASAGAVTATMPTGANFVQRVGTAVSATTIEIEIGEVVRATAIDITNITALTTVVDADELIIYDTTASVVKKITRANLIESAALSAINIDGGAIDGTPIGANSHSTAKFTTLEFTSTFTQPDNAETLSGAKTLTTTSERLQFLDPDGAGRDVNLPAEGSSSGLSFVIINMADGAEDLTVKDDSPATIITVGQDEIGFVFCNGTVWKGFVGVL
jgi:hypothetical protein